MLVGSSRLVGAAVAVARRTRGAAVAGDGAARWFRGKRKGFPVHSSEHDPFNNLDQGQKARYERQRRRDRLPPNPWLDPEEVEAAKLEEKNRAGKRKERPPTLKYMAKGILSVSKTPPMPAPGPHRKKINSFEINIWDDPLVNPKLKGPMWHQEGLKRTGLVALKVGMLGLWDKWGKRNTLTVLHVDDCQVMQVKHASTDGYNALQLGAGDFPSKRLKNTERGHFRAAGVEPKRTVKEFRVSEEALLPVGTRLAATHFVPGQLVDVQGKTRGRGFAGVMKRWGFKGQPASHGVSKTHRAMGSIGQCQSPGRVFKGKKMPGNMGNKTRTMKNLRIYKIDTERQLLYVMGHVPGNRGAYVNVRDAINGPHFPEADDSEEYARHCEGAFPTWTPEADAEPLRPELVMEMGEQDPHVWKEVA